MTAAIKRYVVAVAIAALGLALQARSTPASAASEGVTASCSFTSTTRVQCNMPVLSTAFNAEIHYVTVQCSNSTVAAFNLKQVEVVAIPPGGSAAIGYQMAGNRGSVGQVANAAAIVDIYVKTGTTSEVLIDFSPAPSGTTTCTASLTATY